MDHNTPVHRTSSPQSAGQPTTGHAVTETTYETTRYNIETGQVFADFVVAFESAVPEFTLAQVSGATDWEEIVSSFEAHAPYGFQHYYKQRPSDAMSISGVGRDDALSVSYWMGNHTIAEQMYRHDPGVMLYAPLRVLIYESEEGNAIFSIGKPSDQFGSFGTADITKVGDLLDMKVAALLEGLDVEVPTGLSKSHAAD